MKTRGDLPIALVMLLALSGCIFQEEHQADAQSVAPAVKMEAPSITAVDTVFGQVVNIYGKDNPKDTTTVFDLVFYASSQDTGTTLRLATTKKSQKVEPLDFYVAICSRHNGQYLVTSLRKCFPNFAVVEDSVRAKTIWLYFDRVTGQNRVARVYPQTRKK